MNAGIPRDQVTQAENSLFSPTDDKKSYFGFRSYGLMLLNCSRSLPFKALQPGPITRQALHASAFWQVEALGSDAQVALTTAQSQAVQADFNLSAARAQLLRALGRG